MKKTRKSMRRIYSVILVVAMVLGIFPMGATEVKASTTQSNIKYEPLHLSESFLNEKGGNGIGTKNDYSTARLYPDRYFFYDKTFSDYKSTTYFKYDGYMPESGDLTVNGVPYVFADYEGNDCILLNSTKKSETLELETIGVYEKVYVLATPNIDITDKQ